MTAFSAFYDRRQQAGRATGLQAISSDEPTAPVPKKPKLTLLLSDSESQFSGDESVPGAQAELTQYQDEAPIPETENPLM